MSLPRLLVLTDRSQLPVGRDLVGTVRECVTAGATHVVLRELDLGPDERADLAAGLTAVGVAVVSAHEPLPGCVGVHLPAVGGLDTPPRKLGGYSTSESRWSSSPSRGTSDGRIETPLVGRSCHSAEDVERAVAEGTDYVTLSPFAATESKPGYGPPLPPDAYAGHPVPVFALGGVTPDNAAKAVRAGAHGVAVMGAVMRADDPAGVVAALLEEVTA